MRPAHRIARDSADLAWEAWWDSQGTLFPDVELLRAAKEAERKFERLFWAWWRSPASRGGA